MNFRRSPTREAAVAWIRALPADQRKGMTVERVVANVRACSRGEAKDAIAEVLG